MPGQRFSDKMSDWVRQLLSCCDRADEADQKPALQISEPTNFRREDISIPGLDSEQQRFIREKAISDAQRMHLQPLRSSPSGHFTDKPDPTKATEVLERYSDMATPKSACPPKSTPGSHPSRLDRVVAHGRKISNSFTKPLGYQGVGREGSPYELRALMDPSRTHVIGLEKLSRESFSVAGSEEDKEFGRGRVNF